MRVTHVIQLNRRDRQGSFGAKSTPCEAVATIGEDTASAGSIARPPDAGRGVVENLGRMSTPDAAEVSARSLDTCKEGRTWTSVRSPRT